MSMVDISCNSVFKFVDASEPILISGTSVIVCSKFQETGWTPRHIIAKDEGNVIVGVVPLYLKRFGICYIIHAASYFLVPYGACLFV